MHLLKRVGINPLDSQGCSKDFLPRAFGIIISFRLQSSFGEHVENEDAFETGLASPGLQKSDF